MKESTMRHEVVRDRSVRLNEAQRDLLKRYAKKLAHGNESRMPLTFAKDITAARALAHKRLVSFCPIEDGNCLDAWLTEEGVEHPYVQEMVDEEKRRYEAFTAAEAESAELEVRKKEVLVAALVMYINHLVQERPLHERLQKAGPSPDYLAAMELLKEAKEELKK